MFFSISDARHVQFCIQISPFHYLEAPWDKNVLVYPLQTLSRIGHKPFCPKLYPSQVVCRNWSCRKKSLETSIRTHLLLLESESQPSLYFPLQVYLKGLEFFLSQRKKKLLRRLYLYFSNIIVLKDDKNVSSTSRWKRIIACKMLVMSHQKQVRHVFNVTEIAWWQLMSMLMYYVNGILSNVLRKK